jgi:hypothetical protein
MSDSGGLRKRLTGLATDENLDLWLLTVAALVFTILGVIGVANQAVLASAILALLAFMATAQVRSRRHVADIARGRNIMSFKLIVLYNDQAMRRGDVERSDTYRGRERRDPDLQVAGELAPDLRQFHGEAVDSLATARSEPRLADIQYVLQVGIHDHHSHSGPGGQ